MIATNKIFSKIKVINNDSYELWLLSLIVLNFEKPKA